MMIRKPRRPNRFVFNASILDAWGCPGFCILASWLLWEKSFWSPSSGVMPLLVCKWTICRKSALQVIIVDKGFTYSYQPSNSVSKSEIFCDTVHMARHPSALAGSLRTSEPVSSLLRLSRRTGYWSSRFWAHSLKEWNLDRFKSGVDNSRRYPGQPGALRRLNSAAKRPIVNLGLISMIGFSLVCPFGSE